MHFYSLIVTLSLIFAYSSSIIAEGQNSQKITQTQTTATKKEDAHREQCEEYEFTYSDRSDHQKGDTPRLRNDVYKKLVNAQREAEVGNLDKSEHILDEFLEGEGLNSYEKANVHNLYAFVNYKRQDYPAAIKHYEALISQPDIPLAMEQRTIFTLSQLRFVTEDYCGALKDLSRWFSAEADPGGSQYKLVGQSYDSNNQPDAAIRYYLKAIERAESQGAGDTVHQAVIHGLMAAQYTKLGNHDEARRNHERALDLLEAELSSQKGAMDDPNLHWALAKVYKDIGDTESARRSINTALGAAEDRGAIAPTAWHEFKSELDMQ